MLLRPTHNPYFDARKRLLLHLLDTASSEEPVPLLLSLASWDLAREHSVLTWIGNPVGWLRQLVRMLSVGTVVTNAVAGEPDPIATGLHAAAPLMLLAMIEAGRTVLLRRIGQAQGTLREPIPLVRWALAPLRTFLLWRRMALWQITSYRIAVDTKPRLRRATALLRMRYGRRWRRHAPADLVWMLRAGVAVDEACARVRVLGRRCRRNRGADVIRTHGRGRCKWA